MDTGVPGAARRVAVSRRGAPGTLDTIAQPWLHVLAGMARIFDAKAFGLAYFEYVVQAAWQEPPEYYPRYRSRYAALLRRYASLVGPDPVDVLDVGGGQLALLAKILWTDRAVVADLSGPQFPYLRSQGVETATWNLCGPEQPFERRFDAVFFSEVIEHLPVPGHLVLEKLRAALRPGGKLVCSTPNLYRPRNVAHLALGLPIFDYLRYPTDQGLGHVLEYSADHLRFQLERAGFADCHIEFRHFGHSPKRIVRRVLSWLATPAYLFPRFRDNLLATATAPEGGAVGVADASDDACDAAHDQSKGSVTVNSRSVRAG